MTYQSFMTTTGVTVPAVTAEEMREVDRIVVEEIGFGLLAMMENAGRNLAEHVRMVTDGSSVTILAGNGGNGGGGLACARHLSNRNIPVQLVLDHDPVELDGAARTQFEILHSMDIPHERSNTVDVLESAAVTVDALIGYGLQGAPRGRAAELIRTCNEHSRWTMSLDVPSGLNATTGDTEGVAVDPDRTVTLALPKVGLAAASESLYLADIGIPAAVYRQLDIDYENPFGREYWVELEHTP